LSYRSNLAKRNQVLVCQLNPQPQNELFKRASNKNQATQKLVILIATHLCPVLLSFGSELALPSKNSPTKVGAQVSPSSTTD
jgi:hypothetical protein